MSTAPPPMTSIEIDCRDLDSFMFNVERLLASELYALSSGEEFKAAVSLWCRAWKQTPAGSLPNDDRTLASFSGAGSRWSKVKAMALRGFVLCSDGRLYHPILCSDAIKAYVKKLENRERTAAATAARAAKHAALLAKHATVNVTLNVTTSATDDVPKSQGQGQGQGQSLTPPSPSSTREDSPAATATTSDQSLGGEPERPLARKIRGGADVQAIQLAVRAGDVVCLAGAFRAKITEDRRGDWLRETDGLQIGVVALIFAWRRWQGKPIREPSGFMQARATWNELAMETKRELAGSLLHEYGLADGQAGE